MSFSPNQLDTLVQELVEGVLPQEPWSALRKELEESEHARQVYAGYTRLHSALDRNAKGLKQALTNAPLTPVSPSTTQSLPDNHGCLPPEDERPQLSQP